LVRFCSIKDFFEKITFKTFLIIKLFFIIDYRFQLCLSSIHTVLISIITKIKSSVFPALHLQRALTEYNEKNSLAPLEPVVTDSNCIYLLVDHARSERILYNIIVSPNILQYIGYKTEHS